jgi:hypothetical protein
MAPLPSEPRDPADIRHLVTLTREQRDWINAAAAALEARADHDEDPPAMLEAAAELRRVVRDWDATGCDTRSAEPVEPRLRDALRQIADAESGLWGRIARDALDDRKATSNGHGDAALATPGDAIALGEQGGQPRR